MSATRPSSHVPVPAADDDLVPRVLAGDPVAERALYDAHAPRVYRVAYRLTGDADLALDVVQETFTRVFANLQGFEGRSSLGTWIHTIALSVASNGLRRERRHRERHLALEGQAGLVAPGEPRDVALRERIHAAMATLSEELRLVFVMAAIEGFTHDEIAAALGITSAASRARLTRARAQLRTLLTPYLGVDHD